MTKSSGKENNPVKRDAVRVIRETAKTSRGNIKEGAVGNNSGKQPKPATGSGKTTTRGKE